MTAENILPQEVIAGLSSEERDVYLFSTLRAIMRNQERLLSMMTAVQPRMIVPEGVNVPCQSKEEYTTLAVAVSTNSQFRECLVSKHLLINYQWYST